MRTPLVLDLDRSLAGPDNACRIDLTGWQEAVRFGCGSRTWRAFAQHLDAVLPERFGTVLTGSGDFHHVSQLLLARLGGGEAFDLVVFDNHPDNMRFPFGIHCGSWVRHAARLPRVRRIDVLGISSSDAGWRHAWENYLASLYGGRLRYWTLDVDTRWARRVGLGDAIRNFDSPQALVDAFLAERGAERGAVYLSIDKDVLAPHVARTNWDQGRMEVADLGRVIAALDGRLIGGDITGEISIYRYRTPWKRWLSALDEQPEIAETMLRAWQSQQMAVNRQLLAWMDAAYRR